MGFERTFAAISYFSKIISSQVSRGSQNISNSLEHPKVPFHISVMNQNTEKIALANALARKIICSRKRIPAGALEVNLHVQHSCEIAAVPSLKSSYFTKSLHSIAGVLAFHQASWNKLLACSRETSSPRYSRNSL